MKNFRQRLIFELVTLKKPLIPREKLYVKTFTCTSTPVSGFIHVGHVHSARSQTAFM